MDWLDWLLENIQGITWQMAVMWVIGGVLIYLAIKKEMEPTLLLPMGLGAILVNLPLDGALKELQILYDAGIVTELFPLLLFIGIGAMIDFGPLLSNPKMILCGAAAQFGIFFTLSLARLLGFTLQDAASIAIIGAADGPTSIFVAQHFGTQYIGAIIVAAYSYMALVPMVQPPCIRLVTTKKERMMKMEYNPANISRTTRILFPIFVTFIAGIAAPKSVALVGFLMFGNLLRECLVLDSLSETAQKVLANLISLLLGLSVAPVMVWSKFLKINTIVILALGLVAFCFDTIGGVFFVKFLNLFLKKKINPMVGIFLVIAIIMAVIMTLNKVTGKEKKKKEA